ncbi:hypothetical protein [Actinoplanes siamensis]|uniref:Uncharacterized protein n=1 Tax=Actinoplanes siamensis TaxID=1223317 RepID=A0A919N6F0_9ACTN|nr:hypothetical protein [Actinoplanes siamensis]GIF05220.1 hypothetical protein Asi03nite_27580 [Actinoplanes siamensis]
MTGPQRGAVSGGSARAVGVPAATWRIGIRGIVVREISEDDLQRPATLIVSTAADGISAEDGIDQFTVTRESVRRFTP